MLPRSGWLRAGIERPESIAEHSLRAAMLAWMLAGLEGADPGRAAVLALLHDSQETRTTDLDHVTHHYVHATPNEQITADQTAALPQPLASMLRGLVAEYEGRASLEGGLRPRRRQARDAAAGRRIPGPGNGNTEPFMETPMTALRTKSGRRLSEGAVRLDPAAWWRAFAQANAPAERPSCNGS